MFYYVDIMNIKKQNFNFFYKQINHNFQQVRLEKLSAVIALPPHNNLYLQFKMIIISLINGRKIKAPDRLAILLLLQFTNTTHQLTNSLLPGPCTICLFDKFELHFHRIGFCFFLYLDPYMQQLRDPYYLLFYPPSLVGFQPQQLPALGQS